MCTQSAVAPGECQGPAALVVSAALAAAGLCPEGIAQSLAAGFFGSVSREASSQSPGGGATKESTQLQKSCANVQLELSAIPSSARIGSFRGGSPIPCHRTVRCMRHVQILDLKVLAELFDESWALNGAGLPCSLSTVACLRWLY